jgi:ferredoxin
MQGRAEDYDHSIVRALADDQSVRGEPMKFTSMQHIPLSSAYLCPDCNSIGNCAEHCPACASPILLALANVLDREVENEAIQYAGRSALAA